MCGKTHERASTMGQTITLRGQRFCLKPLSFKMLFLISFTEITKAELSKTVKNTIPSPTDENALGWVTCFFLPGRSLFIPFHLKFHLPVRQIKVSSETTADAVTWMPSLIAWPSSLPCLLPYSQLTETIQGATQQTQGEVWAAHSPWPTAFAPEKLLLPPSHERWWEMGSKQVIVPAFSPTAVLQGHLAKTLL